MSNAKTTTLSGCVIWFLLIFIISSCMLPVFIVAGSVSSSSDFAIKTTGGWLCPEGTTPERYSYATTIVTEFGNREPATAYELHCVDASGAIVKTDPVLYAFVWTGICALVGLIISVVLTFIFAAPGGMLVTKIFNKLKTPRATININQ